MNDGNDNSDLDDNRIMNDIAEEEVFDEHEIDVNQGADMNEEEEV